MTKKMQARLARNRDSQIAGIHAAALGSALSAAGDYTDKGGRKVSRTRWCVPPVASRRTCGADGFKSGRIHGTQTRVVLP